MVPINRSTLLPQLLIQVKHFMGSYIHQLLNLIPKEILLIYELEEFIWQTVDKWICIASIIADWLLFIV